MNTKLFKNILFYGIAGMLIFTPIARGATRLWGITPVLIIIYSLLFLRVLFRDSLSSGTVPFKIQERALTGTVPSGALTGTVPIVAFAVLAIISFVFSIYKHDSFFALLRLFGYIGIYYLVLNNFDRVMRRRLLGIVICVGAGLSLYGFLQYFGALNHSWWNPPEFLAATYVNHNHFAGYLQLVIPLAIAMLFSRRLRPIAYRLAIVAALIIMLAVFIFTQSRGGWISLTISLFTMNVILVRRGMLGKKSLLVFLLILALIVSFTYFNREDISGRIETVTDIRDSSFQTRLKIWQAALKMARDNPLSGVGIGAFDQGFYRYRPDAFDARAVYADNEYLHMAAEMGILAPLFMLWMFINVIAAGFNKKYFNPQRLGCAIGILSLTLHGLTDFNFHIPANMLLFSVCAGLIMAAAREDIRGV